MVTIVDPHIKRDSKYAVHKEATSRGLYIKDKDGNVSMVPAEPTEEHHSLNPNTATIHFILDVFFGMHTYMDVDLP